MIAQLDPLYIRTSPQKTVVRLLSYALFEGRPLTTKGQWINPCVLALYKFYKRLPQLKRVYKPIFVVGTGRSGTTILGTLLSMHRDVGFLNEPKALWHAIYPAEDLVGSYCRGVAHYRLDATDASPQVKTNAHKLFGAYLAISGSRRVVDKYPEIVFRIPFVQALFPDAKFVFLVRNGWDTCHSIKRWSERLGVQVAAENHDWWGADRRKWDLLWKQVVACDGELSATLPERSELEDPINMAALEWIVSMQEGLRLMRQFPNDIHMVRYEDLVAQPQESFSQLLEFCELPPDQRFFNYATQRLKPAPPRKDVTVHPALQPYFEETMAALGYTSPQYAISQ